MKSEEVAKLAQKANAWISSPDGQAELSKGLKSLSRKIKQYQETQCVKFADLYEPFTI